LADAKWQGRARINWCPNIPEHALRAELRQRRSDNARQQLNTHPSQGIPKRLWERLILKADLDGTWAQCSNADLEQLLTCLQRCDLAISGKGPFSEEFVVCGGINRKEIDWRHMESCLQPGLHFAGEVIDQDGLTGGFNLQAAWTTGWIAGRAMATAE
jgi:predicted Rossmann fold flavoprotein